MSTEIDPSIFAAVASYYDSKIRHHGATSRGVDWNDSVSHELRHRQFLRLLDNAPHASILDLGCGYGDFLRFLRQAGHHGKFIGCDMVPAMIAKARQIHGEGVDRSWQVGTQPMDIADVAIASGIFNVKGEIPLGAWVSYVRETIGILARVGQRGFGFNVLSRSSDPERRAAHLYYADALEMLDWCMAQFGRSVALLQDYGLYEFTILVRKSAA